MALMIFHNVLAAGLFGAMLFFPAVVVPAVFGALDDASSGMVLRRLFPRYYVFGMVVAMALTGSAIALDDGLRIALAGLVLAGFAVSQVALAPRINAARDASKGPNAPENGRAEASRRFARLHGLSVIVNIAQMVAVLALLLAPSAVS